MKRVKDGWRTLRPFERWRKIRKRYYISIIKFVNSLIVVSDDHDDVIKWKHFPRYWPFVRGIHRSPVNSPHKGQWRGALMLSLICVWINGWINNRQTGDLRRYPAHYDVILMWFVDYAVPEPLLIYWELDLLEQTVVKFKIKIQNCRSLAKMYSEMLSSKYQPFALSLFINRGYFWL